MAPRRPNKSEKKRVALELSTVAVDSLNELQEMTDADSRSEVIRHSLNLYHFVVTENKAGASVIVRSTDGSEREIEII